MAPERLYAALLHFYPTAFREEYGREMRASFRRRWHDEPGLTGRALLCLSVPADTFVTAAGEHFDMLINDIRYSLRTLRKTPAFTIAALATLALAIGATTAIYSLVHTVLLRPLPYTEPDHLVRIYETNLSRNIPEFSASVLNFLSWQERSGSFEALAAIGSSAANLTGDGEPQRVNGSVVSAHFFSMMGLQPLLGRSFIAEEDVPERNDVVMVSEGLWQQRYARDEEVIGRKILVNGIPRVIVGIAPQHVGFTSATDLWMPLAPNPAEEIRGDHQITVIGRLRPGVSIAEADAELNAVAKRLEQEFPETNAGWGVRLVPVRDWIIDSNTRVSLYVLMAAVALLLAAGCANVAGLLVTRATARAHELGVRLALGAGRGRLMRQLTTESLVLSFLGGTLGIPFAVAAMHWLAARIAAQSPPLPRSGELAMDWPVFGFAFGLTVGVGLIFALAPALWTGRADISKTLRIAGRGVTGSSGARLRLGLVGTQIAVATMLVVGALLLAQSLIRLQRVDLGFRPDHLLTARLSLPYAKYPTQEKVEAFYKTLLSEVLGLPGVTSAGISSGVPMAGNNTNMPIVPVERPDGVPEQGVQAFWRIADAEYLRTLQVPLHRGRLFEAGDSERPGIILSENLARRLWPNGADPIDRRVRLGNGQFFNVIGIVGDVRQLNIQAEPQSTMYFYRLFVSSTLTLAIRTAVDPATLSNSLRETVLRIDPELPLFSVRTMDQILEANAASPRLQTALLSAFALLAVLLGSVGVAGVVAYSVEQRRAELALHLALGATPAQAMRNAARGGLIASVLGLVLGLLGAWGLSQSLSSLLYEIRPDHPPTFAIVAAALFCVALISCWLPARRATRIDPASALRQ
jgi:putative ABC transport system permease protein